MVSYSRFLDLDLDPDPDPDPQHCFIVAEVEKMMRKINK